MKVMLDAERHASRQIHVYRKHGQSPKLFFSMEDPKEGFFIWEMFIKIWNILYFLLFINHVESI